MGALAEREEEKKRETVFLMEDFPPSPNLVRGLIKLQGSKVAVARSLYLFLSLSLPCCLSAVCGGY